MKIALKILQINSANRTQGKMPETPLVCKTILGEMYFRNQEDLVILTKYLLRFYRLKALAYTVTYN